MARGRTGENTSKEDTLALRPHGDPAFPFTLIYRVHRHRHLRMSCCAGMLRQRNSCQTIRCRVQILFIAVDVVQQYHSHAPRDHSFARYDAIEQSQYLPHALVVAQAVSDLGKCPTPSEMSIKLHCIIFAGALLS